MKIPDKAKLIFKGVIFDVYHWEETNFDGSIGIWEGLKRKPGVQLFVQTTEGKWLLQDEARPTGWKFLALPGGQMEEGEDPLISAKRELLEEAGMTGDFTFIDKIQIPAPRTEWDGYFYLVTNAKKIQEPNLDPGEKIKPLLLNFEEYIEKISDNDFSNKQAKNYIQILEKSKKK